MSDSLRVMIVEDEMMIALTLEDMLTDLGHEVVASAAHVDGALEALAHLPHRPDAAVVDANLAGESALPVVEALRTAGSMVVVASGYGPRELARLGFSEPALSKPYQPEELAQYLTRIQEIRQH